MNIEKIDPNFNLRESAEGNDRTEYVIPHPSFDLYGVFYHPSRGFVRMDPNIAEKVSVGVNTLSGNTAGGRLRFSTDSTLIRIKVQYNALCSMSHMPQTGSGGFSLFEETNEGETFIKNMAPGASDTKGFSMETTLPGGGMHDYIMYFPLYNNVSSLSVFLSRGATVQGGRKYRSEVAPILYYGSSITQGGCASRPDNSYQSLISKWNNIDYINLGFSGNARGEDTMTEYLSGIDCSLFVCDYDHNAPSAEYLLKTHFRLYENYRKIRPGTPILFISRPDYTGSDDDAQRIKVIMQTYRKARRLGDTNVYFLSGRSFYKKNNRWNFSVDGVHPTDFGFYRMAVEIYRKIQKIDPIFK